MTTPRDISGSPERHSIGLFFDALSDLVENFPTLIGTSTSKVVQYSQGSFSPAAQQFNAAAKFNERQDRAAAATHVYRLGAVPKIEGAPEADDAAALAMMKKMQRLQELCQRNQIGLTVSAPAPGVVQVNLVETARPKRAFKIPPPKIRFGRGF